MTDKLPKFEQPPVMETVLGVAFKPMISWQTPHFGLYWNRIRSQYKFAEVQPPLPVENEAFGDARKEITLKLGRPDDRCWFIEDKGKWLLQIQNSRFISNWRRKPIDKYPNFKSFLERFNREWTRFNDFLHNEGLETPELKQAEVSYVNHIDVESDFSNLPSIFPSWNGFKKKGFLPFPEAIGFNAVFVIPENKGRLYITAQPVLRHHDLKSVLQLTLTAKTIIDSNSNKDVIDALKLGHEWVVSGFADFTSEKMHLVWQRTQ